MSLSVQHSDIESFSFRGKKVWSMNVPDLGECLVVIDVSRAIQYADDNNNIYDIIKYNKIYDTV